MHNVHDNLFSTVSMVEEAYFDILDCFAQVFLVAGGAPAAPLLVRFPTRPFRFESPSFH